MFSSACVVIACGGVSRSVQFKMRTRPNLKFLETKEIGDWFFSYANWKFMAKNTFRMHTFSSVILWELGGCRNYEHCVNAHQERTRMLKSNNLLQSRIKMLKFETKYRASEKTTNFVLINIILIKRLCNMCDASQFIFIKEHDLINGLIFYTSYYISVHTVRWLHLR